jgi:hypothetical protein
MMNDDVGQMPDSMFWLALEHSCGCAIDWGCDDRHREELIRFLPVAAPLPCPVHGSNSGIPAPPLGDGEIRLLTAIGLFYRSANDEQRADAQRNRKLALSRPPARE